MKSPRLSVLMPVYNAERYLEESIRSILNQTFSDFELLIGDDGCTDRSIQIINTFKDDRIVVIRNEKNLGIANTLNKLIDAARGEYIARHDSDDIAQEKRFEKQIGFLATHPEIGVCGTNFTCFGSKIKRMFMPPGDDEIRTYMLVNNPICHPTVMVRKSCLTSKYDQLLFPAEDYALWYELSKGTKLVNLQESLLKYRWHDSNISTTSNPRQVEAANAVRATIFKETLNHNINEKETQILNQVVDRRLSSFTDLDFFEKFLLTIRSRNKETAYYKEEALQQRIFRLWTSACFKLKGIGIFKKISTFLKSEIFSFSDFMKLIVQTIRQ
ncbi:MAG: glycosyltransferase [Prolixibacteraceae bacterium]